MLPLLVRQSNSSSTVDLTCLFSLLFLFLFPPSNRKKDASLSQITYNGSELGVRAHIYRFVSHAFCDDIRFDGRAQHDPDS